MKSSYYIKSNYGTLSRLQLNFASINFQRVLIPDTCTKEIKRSPFKFEEEFFISKGRVTFDFWSFSIHKRI